MKQKLSIKQNMTTRQIVLCVVLGFFLVFGIPFLINWAFTYLSFEWLQIKWGASDALSYYGSLMGASATIYVLRKTILFTEKNQKAERVLTIRPYLQTYQRHYADVCTIPESDDILYFTVTNGIMTIERDTPDCIARLKMYHKKLHNREPINGKEKAICESINTDFFKNNYVMSYEIENCGAGNAVDVNLKINERPLFMNFCITTNKTKQMVFIFNNDLIKNTSATLLNLSITYTDVASLAQYVQCEKFRFSRSHNDNLQMVQFGEDLLTRPQQV